MIQLITFPLLVMDCVAYAMTTIKAVALTDGTDGSFAWGRERTCARPHRTRLAGAA